MDPSEKQLPIGMGKMIAFFAVVVAAWCVTIQGAEIHEAAELGNLEKVKACLSRDPKEINLVDAKGRTVLARAALSGKRELVELLLEKGARPSPVSPRSSIRTGSPSSPAAETTRW